ncbi:hypothetical protein FRC01_005017 [Tulasnella sp. 417]|nr:hypothetical protein FRC01_005017 [Tulasnella sp. 417]
MSSVIVISLLLASTSLAAPLQGSSTASSNLKSGLYNIARRGIKANPVANDDPIFDPTYAQAEIQRVLSKYKQAAHLIHNVHLPPHLKNLLHNPNYLITDDISPELDAAYRGEAIQDMAGSRQALMPLMDYISGNLDILYYGPINMGSQNQRMTFDIDTGSADLWVPVNCPDCPHPGYAAERSSTYRETSQDFSVQYGTGEVSGVLAQDRVAVGSLVVNDQYFGAVNQESDDFEDSPNDGLIGMAFSTIATSGQPTFFENLLNSNKLAAPIFSIYLTRHRSSGSSLCLGCYDSSKAVGPITWVPVTSMTYWAVSMPSARINGKAVDMSTSVTAAIDSGTTLIYVPRAVASAIYRQIPGARQADAEYGEGFWTYPCNSNLNIQLGFGDNYFALNPVDFNLGRTEYGSTTCVGGILGMGAGFPGDLAIIGDEFLKSWYSVFDYSHGARVGFAQSINNH